MTRHGRLVLVLTLTLALAGGAAANYQPRETFAPFDMAQPVNGYRGPNGLPGPAYWQNRADYTIAATLDPAAKTIIGTVDIRYHNNSPDTLDALWLQIDQNIYRPASRGALARGGSPRGITQGMIVDTAAVEIRHPKPADFFRAIESGAGEDLSWWWNGWYANNWQMDLAVTGLEYVKGDPANGALITVSSRDRLVMPAVLRVTFANDRTRDIRLPAETWIRQDTIAVAIPEPTRIVRAELDPDHRLPDRDRSNNLFVPAS